jgi:putative hydrolase of the HAD superfamily
MPDRPYPSRKEPPRMESIRWLFFDLGSTLLDETQSYPRWFQNASDAIGGALSPQEIEQGYSAGMVVYAPTVVGQLKPYGYAGTSANHLYPTELDAPYPDAAPVLAALSRKYMLGVIANQVVGTEARLARYGLKQYMQVIVASVEAGVSKPDPAIFTLALAQADCAPWQAVMIGDRLDNDIFPAKRMGMVTVRILQGYGRLQAPKSAEYTPDFTVNSLSELLEIF